MYTYLSVAGLHKKLVYPGKTEEEFMVEIVSLDDDDHDYVDEDHDDIRYFEVTDSSDDYDTKTLATENNKIIRNGELEEKKLSSGLTAINKDGVLIVEDGVYWSQNVEDNIAPGLNDNLIQVNSYN